MRTLFLLALLITLGAGCVSPQAQTPNVAQDFTLGVNEDNCTKSGGTVADGACECPENDAPDPAGFCLDERGRPGGEMAPK